MSAGDRDREVQVRECCPGEAEEGERRGDLHVIVCVYELHLCNIEKLHLPVYVLVPRNLVNPSVHSL